MFGRGKRGKPKDPPTVAIQKANECIKKEIWDKAFSILFESISFRHRAQFDQTYEEAMKLYIDVGVIALRSCKEGFLHYRSLVQQVMICIVCLIKYCCYYCCYFIYLFIYIRIIHNH